MGRPKRMKVQNKVRIHNKWIVIGVAIGIVLILALIFSTVFALVNIGNDKILSGITIEGIDVAGLTRDAAMEKVQEAYKPKLENDINLKYQDFETSLNPTVIELNYDVEKAVDEAYEIGKGDNIFINNYSILFSLFMKKNIDVDMSLNEDTVKQSISEMEVSLPGRLVESNYSVEGDKLIINKGSAGGKIDEDSLLNKIKENLRNVNSSDGAIEIPVTQENPQPIDIQKIHDEVYKQAQDAYYTEDPYEVYPEVDGVDFDVEAAKKVLEEDKDEYTIDLTITKPEVTLDQIGDAAFPDQLSIFTTRYDVSDVDRSTNLELACSKLDGKVVHAGDTFSYNDTLGARTVATGYKNAKIYENGQVVDGIGGGICQISSTLYNAVLRANLQIVERRNHQFVTSYVPAGLDATVVYGSTDFKFKNTRKYPIRIKASAQNGIATIAIYGIKEDPEYEFSFNTVQVETIPYTTKYIDDSSLAKGTEKVQQLGANGLKTQTYMTKMLNGKVVETTLLSEDTYNPMTRIIRRGV